jgi:CRISPR/Cas system-associated exonuclease Cas4 (RecB family)
MDIINFLTSIIKDAYQADIDLVLFMVLAVSASIVFDAVTMYARKNKIKAGIESENSRKSLGSVKTIIGKKYVSDIQGLAGTPDAVLIENGHFIPVERKPLAKKIRDRYVAQLLVYMRLIEEFEGKKPPYGYLILGTNCRRIKIENTEERQAWLQGILNEMQAYLKNNEQIIPTPQVNKCKQCPHSESCEYSMTRPKVEKLRIL